MGIVGEEGSDSSTDIFVLKAGSEPWKYFACPQIPKQSQVGGGRNSVEL